MFYTTEEAAVLCGFLDGYLERDSVDAAVREKYEKFRLGLVQESLGREDYMWAIQGTEFSPPALVAGLRGPSARSKTHC